MLIANQLPQDLCTESNVSVDLICCCDLFRRTMMMETTMEIHSLFPQLVADQKMFFVLC